MPDMAVAVCVVATLVLNAFISHHFKCSENGREEMFSKVKCYYSSV